MGIINVLDISVANMIAAGEVVERPASVIKELVENSIDAGADNIIVEIRGGGISYMRVTDNGSGIASDDVGLAFVRHATSKIKDAKDLEAIGTLGFRGEALCSVASVSKVVLTSKTQDASFATRVYIDGGEMENVEEVGAPDGTTIEVKKLFYNTPARMKFLKRDTTEAGYITDIMQRFILAHPEIAFKYINNGKLLLSSSGDGKLINAIYTVYGRDYAKSVIEVSYGDSVLKITGYIGKSTISRPNRLYQSFFVNGRYIKSRTITAALDEAYKNQLMGGRFPFAVINLELNPSLLDVNVHPNKLEVKFSDEKKVFDTVYWGAKNALYEKPIVPDINIKAKKDAYKNRLFTSDEKEFVQTFMSSAQIINSAKKSQEDIQVQEDIKTSDEKIKDEINKKSENVVYNAQQNFTNNTHYDLKENVMREESVEYKSQKENILAEKSEKEDTNIQNLPKEQNENIVDNTGIFDYKIAGTIFNTYIILEYENEIRLIDQHAAHERIKYEQLRREVENDNIQVQSLISPVVISLSATEMAYLSENIDALSSLGFEAEPFGENKYIINGVPMGIEYDDVGDLFVELLGQMMGDKKHIIGEKQERAMYTVACKAAIKANKNLSKAEIDGLVKEVLALKNINTCPHGRPIMVSLSKYEIEKQFGRIV